MSTQDVSTHGDKDTEECGILLFNSLKRGNVITFLPSPSKQSREGGLYTAEHLQLYLRGWGLGRAAEEEQASGSIMYAPPQTTESADNRAQHAQSSIAAK